MAGALIAERPVVERLVAERLVDEPSEGAGGPARYVLYAAAAAAALAGAWLIAGPAMTSTPAPLSVRTAPMPVADNVRQIDMSQPSSPAPAPAAAVAEPTAADNASSETATLAPEPIPPKPLPRPARPSVAAPIVAAPAPVVREAAPMVVQTGAPPANLGVLHEPAAPSYVVPSANAVPAAPAVQSAAPSGPVPPMPVDNVVDNRAPPANEPVHHQGLLGATERAAGTVWNWTTGAVDNTVRTVQQGF